jgi:hypothetical protein
MRIPQFTLAFLAILIVLAVTAGRHQRPQAAGSGGEVGTHALPSDGKPLFDFLLAEIPHLADKVPCSCCPFSIGDCYRGACPTSCGPCNQIGRDTFQWHQEGVSDDEIVSRVQAKYLRSR